MILVQLLGLARSGKDFTAEQLKLQFEQLGYSVSIKSYAAPLKRIAANLFGISLEQLDIAKNNPSMYPIYCGDYGGDYFETDFREFLQRLGNDAIKPEFGNSVWADLMVQQVNQSIDDIIIISDCRFLTELQAFPNAQTVRIVNDNLTPMNHTSELELLDVPTTHVLDNTNYKALTTDFTILAGQILDRQACTTSTDTKLSECKHTRVSSIEGTCLDCGYFPSAKPTRRLVRQPAYLVPLHEVIPENQRRN